MPFPYIALILFAASTILGELMRPKPQQAKKPTFEDFQVNTADKNRPLAVLWGRQEIRGGNFIWYGDYDNSPIIKKTRNPLTLGITETKQTIGYRHYIGFAMAFGYGAFDKIYRIKFGEKTAWANESGQPMNGTITVKNLNLFGGDDNASGGRGGVYSIVDLYNGTRTQAANAYLSGLDSTHSAYRGLAYLVWRGATGGGSIASPNKTGNIQTGYVGNTESLDSITIEAERCPRLLSNFNPWYRIGNGDANPVECLYELLTNAEWGLGKQTGYGGSWVAAAQTVHSEGLGFSVLLDNQKSIKSMASEILDQIGGILITDNATGNWELKLARKDYNIATLPILEAVKPGETSTGLDCIVDVTEYSCGAYDETTGVVKVAFNERLPDNNYQPNTAFVYDKANISIQNQPLAAQLSYPGVTSYEQAVKLAWRELIARSIPLKKCKVITDTNGARFKPGDCFKLKWIDYRVNQVIFRVLSVNRGSLKSGSIELNVVQDIFALGDTLFAAPPASSWVDPITDASPVSIYKLLEQPRHTSGDTRNIWAFARKPAGSTNYDFYVSTDNGSSYAPKANAVDFTPVGTLVDALPRGTSDTSNGIIVNPVYGLGLLEPHTAAELSQGFNLAYIEGQNELIAFENFTQNENGQITLNNVWRGLLDTTPKAHTANARIWFITYGLAATFDNYANGSTVFGKMVARSPRGELALADAPAQSLIIGNRHLKPYPPGNVVLDDTASNNQSGFVSVSWKNKLNVLDSANTLTKNSGSNDWGDAGATGNQSIPANADGKTRYTVQNYNTQFAAFGLSQNSINHNFTSITYNASFHKNDLVAYIYYGNSWTGAYTSIANGDVFEFRRSGAVVSLYKNDSLVHTYAQTTTSELFVGAAIATNGGVLAGIEVTSNIGGAVNLSWAHRNRLNQPLIIRQNNGNITPEAGQTYTIKIYGQNGALIKTESGITGNSYTYPAIEEALTNGGALHTTLTVELLSVRDGLESYHSQVIVRKRA